MPPEAFLPENAHWLIVAWIAAMGALIGSFLNVVVYRVPAGLNIAWPGSRCPKCKHDIRWYDNVPVVSWLWLRGRCRDCGTAISARYPTVEATAAAMFLILACIELFTGGRNLPLREIWVDGEIIAIPRSSEQLWATYGYHVVLLCTLLASGLVAYDRHRPPLQLYLFAAVVGLLLPPICGSVLRPWPAVILLDNAWLDGLVGLGVGLVLMHTLRWLLSPLFSSITVGRAITEEPGRRPNGGLPTGKSCSLGWEGFVTGYDLPLVGLFLGWQMLLAVCNAAISWVALAIIVKITAGRRGADGSNMFGRLAVSAGVPLFTFAGLLCWARLAPLFTLR